MPASTPELSITTPNIDLAHCRELLCSGSRSFYAASHLLPAPVRDAACRLYAFCREADDLIDEGDDPARALALLEQRLSAVYSGEPGPGPIDRALADVVRRYRVPRALLDALLEGFAWDAQSRQYDSLSDVLDYSARVAGSVGVMMALLQGARAPDTLARAADLGLAMQLTNIARDVGEDARAGRLYLPRAWLREAGIDPDDFLARPTFSAGLASVIERLLAEAETLYRRADSGIAVLPRRCRPGIYAARMFYAEIGAQLARHDHDAVGLRSVVPARRKLMLLARLPRAWWLDAPALAAPVADQTRFLVSAVAQGDAEAPPERGASGGFGERLAWTVELFSALEARDRAQFASRASWGSGSPRHSEGQ
jgi:phytoene synthase